jgi:hypothetical protein
MVILQNQGTTEQPDFPFDAQTKLEALGLYQEWQRLKTITNMEKTEFAHPFVHQSESRASR